MSTEGEGNVSDLTIEVLKGIRSDLQELRVELKGGLADVRAELNQGLAEVRAELRHGLSEVRDEVHEVRTGLQELADHTQSGFAALLSQGDRRFLDHEGRLRALEVHTGLDPHRRG